jgi:flagellar biosynthesis component FlhA
MRKARSVLALLLVGLGLIAASVGLGFWFAAVNTACEKPYRDDLGDIISGMSACKLDTPHAGLFLGEIVLIILTIVVGLAGLVVLVSSLVALFSKVKTPQDRRADFDRKVAETKARDAAREAAAQRQHQEKIQAAASELAASVAPIQLPRLGLAINDGIIYVVGTGIP